jgi:type II secretory pathway component GspD/PulD (secretin)
VEFIVWRNSTPIVSRLAAFGRQAILPRRLIAFFSRREGFHMSRCLAVIVVLLSLVPAFSADETTTVKVYRVADLVSTFNEKPAAQAVDHPKAYTGDKTAAACATPENDLIKLVTDLVAPASWSLHGGAGSIEYYPMGKGLVVRQTPEVHEQLGQMLDALRKSQDVGFEIETLIMRVPESVLQSINIELGKCDANAAPMIVDEKQMKSFMGAFLESKAKCEVLNSARLKLINGQEGSVSVGEARSFITGMTIENVDGNCKYVPQNKSFDVGTRFEAVGVVAADRNYVSLKCKGQITELQEPVELSPVTMMINPAGGEDGRPTPFVQYIQNPKITRVAVEKSAAIPFHHSMMIVVPETRSDCKDKPAPPILSKIPYYDRLFKNAGSVPEKRATVFVLTPHIVETSKIDRKHEVSVNCIIAKVDAASTQEFEKHGLNKDGVNADAAAALGGFAFSAAGNAANNLLRSLKTQGRIDVLNTANLRLFDNQQGVVSVGGIYPYVVGASTDSHTVSPSFTYRTDVGATVELTPHINPDGKVSLRVELSEIAPIQTPILLGSGLKATAFTNQALEMTVLADDGETVVIGGLVSEKKTVSEHKIPYLADLPYVGDLFHYSTKKEPKKETLIVFLTPHIIRNSGEVDRSDVERTKADASRLSDQPAPQYQPAPALPAPTPLPPTEAPALIPPLSAAPVTECPYPPACPARAAEVVKAQLALELPQPEPILVDLPVDTSKQGLQQVQLDVTIARVDRSKLPSKEQDAVGNGNVPRAGSILADMAGMIKPGPYRDPVFGIVPAQMQETLQALKAKGIAKLIAEPKLVTSSGRPARFSSGGQQAVLGASSDGDKPLVTYVNVGLEFEALPIVRGDGKIYLEVNPRVRSVNEELGVKTSWGDAPGFEEQAVNSSVVLENGQTFAIGGLIRPATETKGEQELIILVTPHLIDAMDSNQSATPAASRNGERELIILVTPHVLDQKECNQAAMAVPPVAPRLLIPCEAIDSCPAQPACRESCASKMNLADVAALSMSGVSDDIILNQIRTTGAAFCLGAEEIIWLKKNGVSDRVVMEMQNSRLQPTEATKANCPLSESNKKMNGLLIERDVSGQINREDADRFWSTGPPSTMSYERLSGYIGP